MDYRHGDSALARSLMYRSRRAEAVASIKSDLDYAIATVSFVFGMTLVWAFNGRETPSLPELWICAVLVSAIYLIRVWRTRRKFARWAKDNTHPIL